MANLLVLLSGIFSSFFGSSTPSMLNMTALKISFEKGKKQAINYSLGVSCVILFQAFLGSLIAEQVEKYPTFLITLEKIAAFIFLILAVYFYREYKNQKERVRKDKNTKSNSFLVGIILSALNMFAIPFYFGVSAFLSTYDWFIFKMSTMILFAIGSAIGTFGILFVYGKFATYIENKATLITKNINLVLSIITGFIGIFTIIKLFF